MDIKVVNKSEIIKYVAVVLAFVLLITTVVFGVKNNNANKSNEELNSQLAENESLLSEKESENKVLQEEKNNLDKLYKDALDKNVYQESMVDDLNKQIDELQKQISKKKGDKNEEKTVLPRPIPAEGKTVYLTFDDGPCSLTPEILDILDKYNVKATFFVVNGKYNYLMKEIVDRGHKIGLHCYKHNYKTIYSSDEAYFKDLQKISDVVEKETGVKADIIRFPGGSSNTISKKYSDGIMTRLTESVVEKGYAYFDWNCYNGDADGEKNINKMVTNCSKFPKKTDKVVVLMHDNKEATVKALPYIIEYYKSCGMEFGVLEKGMEYTNHTIKN